MSMETKMNPIDELKAVRNILSAAVAGIDSAIKVNAEDNPKLRVALWVERDDPGGGRKLCATVLSLGRGMTIERGGAMEIYDCVEHCKLPLPGRNRGVMETGSYFFGTAEAAGRRMDDVIAAIKAFGGQVVGVGEMAKDSKPTKTIEEKRAQMRDHLERWQRDDPDGFADYQRELREWNGWGKGT